MSLEHAPQLIKRQRVQTITSLSKSSIYAKVADGTFPKPVKLGPKAVAWRLSDIHDWIDSLSNGGGAE